MTVGRPPHRPRTQRARRLTVGHVLESRDGRSRDPPRLTRASTPDRLPQSDGAASARCVPNGRRHALCRAGTEAHPLPDQRRGRGPGADPRRQPGPAELRQGDPRPVPPLSRRGLRPGGYRREQPDSPRIHPPGLDQRPAGPHGRAGHPHGPPARHLHGRLHRPAVRRPVPGPGQQDGAGGGPWPATTPPCV